MAGNTMLGAAPRADHARPAVPFMVATGAIMVFTTMDAVVKSLPHALPTIEVVAMRFLFGIPLVLLVMWHGRSGWPSRASWKANTPRGLLNVASTLLFFTALRYLPFAEALSLSYLAPLILAVLATLMLGERLRGSVVAAVLLGLVGVGVIARDALRSQGGLSTDLVGIAAAMGSAVTYATNNALLRRQARHEHPAAIVFTQHVIPALAALPFAAVQWQPPAPAHWATFGVLAVLGVSGHFLLTWAYGRAQAGVLAVVDYLALPYAALLGWVFFGEVPAPAMWLGAALIVAASVLVTRRRA
jgi:S-adenosylmethionine uptake transporter